MNIVMNVSFFTGEQHSESFNRIIRLLKEMGFSVRVYDVCALLVDYEEI